MTKAGDRLLQTDPRKTTAYAILFVDENEELRLVGSVLGRLFYTEQMAEEALPRMYAAFPNVPQDEFHILPLEYGP